MKNLDERLKNLTPEKRRALERMLARESLPMIEVRRQLQELVAVEKEPEPVAADAGAAPELSRLTVKGGKTAAHLKEEVKQFYNSVSQQLDATEYGDHALFLNYGYVSDGSPEFAAVPLPERTLNRHSVKLVLELISDYPLSGSTLLDVGCGRGGTADTIAQYFEPKGVVGLDLSPAAIAFCRRRYRHPALSFRTGDAENLPFAAGSFDYVVNVESSHSYADIESFYRSVYEILRPGGVFLYADNLPVARWRACLALLQGIGFQVEVDRNITANVLLSCDEQARRRAQTFNPNNPAEVIDNFLAVPGSPIYEEMRNGTTTYRILGLRRDEGRGGGDPQEKERG